MNPYIIAELSANHNGSFDRAMKTIDAAAEAGASAVKFQTFTPEKMAIPGYTIESGSWVGRELIELYREARTPPEWHDKLFKHAWDRGLEVISSPFDEHAVDFLDRLGCQQYKIASFEIIDLQLIAKVARTGKPIIISTGMADLNEIRAAVNTAKGNGCFDITLLHCVSEYPAKPEDMNLSTMNALSRFDCKVGLSDHSLGIEVSVAATALGASVIEKHLTISREGGGLDSGFSMEPDEFKRLVAGCGVAKVAIGDIKFGQGNKDLRRSLYYSQDIQAGTEIEKHHLKTARPALGESPLKIDRIIGKILTVDVKENDPVQA
jgi:N-acetylneuraminate synthase